MQPEETYALLRRAIVDPQHVLADYHGHRREFCPHVLGRLGDELRCLGYQFAGASSSGPLDIGSSRNWRCFVVSELTNVQTRAGPWYTAPTTTYQTCVSSIDVQVPARHSEKRPRQKLEPDPKDTSSDA